MNDTQATYDQEFDAQHSGKLGWNIEETFADYNRHYTPDREQQTVKRLRGIFAHLRAECDFNAEQAYELTIRSLLACLNYCDDPEVTTLKHYRRELGQDI